MNYHQITIEERYRIARASRRKWASRRRWQFTDLELQMVITLIQLDWSPEQAALWLNEEGIFSTSYTTI